jgi:hypothetical protein
MCCALFAAAPFIEGLYSFRQPKGERFAACLATESRKEKRYPVPFVVRQSWQANMLEHAVEHAQISIEQELSTNSDDP